MAVVGSFGDAARRLNGIHGGYGEIPEHFTFTVLPLVILCSAQNIGIELKLLPHWATVSTGLQPCLPLLQVKCLSYIAYAATESSLTSADCYEP